MSETITKNHILAGMAELADAHGSGDTTSVNLQNHVSYLQKIKYADMAELADAHGSGPCESNFMQVQVLLSAPKKARFYRAFCYFIIQKMLADA